MDVLQNIENCRFYRVYKNEQISETEVNQILTAALQSSSARNHQPRHFLLFRIRKLIQEVHNEATKVLKKDGSQCFTGPDCQIFYHAPTVVFIFGKKDFSWTKVDCRNAAQNMALAVEWHGFGSVNLGLPKAFSGDEVNNLRKKLHVQTDMIL